MRAELRDRSHAAFGSPARALRLALVLGAAACGSNELPPTGQALIVVDTDLPVPALAARLRIDLYAEDGTWYESQTLGLRSPRDWPASFGVISPDNAERRVLLRLRTYPEGRERDYLGERFAARAPYVAPTAGPRSMNELCAAPPELPLGGTVTLRRGRDPFIGELFEGDCGEYSTRVGSTAAAIDIAQPGSYRFGVLAVEPSFYQVTLQLRGACADASTAVDCSTGIVGESPYPLPELGPLDLAPGRYHLVTGGTQPYEAPADIVLGAAESAAWPPVRAAAQPVPEQPQLTGPGKVTPTREPQPLVTVDRLLLVRIVPDTVLSTRVTLRGACLGTMAQLQSAWPHQQPVLGEASTCVDTEGARAVVVEAPMDTATDTSPSLQGTFSTSEPCGLGAPGAEVVCVPGGFFLLGSTETRDGEETDSLPEHPAFIPRFTIDRHEVTVQRYRQALADGFNPGLDRPFANDATLDTTVVGEDPDIVQNDGLCTWSTEFLSREEWPLNCISWYGARAMCRFYGGDLPTEAQWEYVATAAGRPFETPWPWGEGDPRCDQAVVGRTDRTLEGELGACSDGSAATVGPLWVTALEGPTGDETAPLDGQNGIVGLAGSVREWVRDAFRPLDHPCWEAAPLVDAKCLEEDAPQRGMRGGNWFADPREAWVTVRQPTSPQARSMLTGFRCVYPGPGAR